jgi:hypothetical protein
MWYEKSAEAILAVSIRGEGPNFMLRNGNFVVRADREPEGVSAMMRADVEDSGRKLRA